MMENKINLSIFKDIEVIPGIYADQKIMKPEINNTCISSLNSRHRKVSKTTAGVLDMRAQMGTVPFNRLRLDCAGCHSNSFLCYLGDVGN